jgi:hypothetical protein
MIDKFISKWACSACSLVPSKSFSAQTDSQSLQLRFKIETDLIRILGGSVVCGCSQSLIPTFCAKASPHGLAETSRQSRTPPESRHHS